MRSSKKNGCVADIMRRTRAAYHYAVRHVKHNMKDIARRRFVECMLCNSDRDFWAETKRMVGKRTVTASIVDGLSSPDEIADVFASKYQPLYNSVPYNVNDMNTIREELDNGIAQSGFTSDFIVNYREVSKAVSCLEHNKNDGGSGLSTDHFKYAGPDLLIYVACLFSGLLVHGSVSIEFLTSTTIPIPKGKNVNLADFSNYRGITLGSIFRRIFDLIILDRYWTDLSSTELQFGFKYDRSTAMCIMILKQVVSFYVKNKSNIRCVFLDAT
jgi:hypothetical protein